jgi:hypothetical protein
MGAGRRADHEGAKGAKMSAIGIICAFALTLCALVTVNAPLRAGEPVDPETLRLAQRMAVSELDRAVPHVMRGNLAERQAPAGRIGTPEWAEGVVGLVSFYLRGANPGRDADVAAYINGALIPEMEARRDAYLCAYTRLYYSFGRNWIWIQGMIDSLPDPFAPVAYFIAPTRDYLRAHDLSLSPVMLHELERDARFAPNGSFWQGIAALPDHIPCASGADARRKSFGVRT